MIGLMMVTACVPPACGPGTFERNGTCVSRYNCGPGTEWVDGECVIPDACGSDTGLDDGSCAALACGEGTVRRGDVCVPLLVQYVHLPYEPGLALEVSQGHHGLSSHAGREVNAVDFVAEPGTPVVAMRGGWVLAVFDGSDITCDAPACEDLANHVIVDHGDASLGEYRHLAKDGARVAVGDRIGAGAVVGLSGNTGVSAEPHFHVEIHDLFRQSLPLRFEELLDVSGGIVAPGMQIVSENEAQPPVDTGPSECPSDTFGFLGVLLDPGVPCTTAERDRVYPVSGRLGVGERVFVAHFADGDWVYDCVDASDGRFDTELSFDGPGFEDTSFLMIGTSSERGCFSDQSWDTSPVIRLR